jgi:hypothetical protein
MKNKLDWLSPIKKPFIHGPLFLLGLQFKPVEYFTKQFYGITISIGLILWLKKKIKKNMPTFKKFTLEFNITAFSTGMMLSGLVLNIAFNAFIHDIISLHISI